MVCDKSSLRISGALHTPVLRTGHLQIVLQDVCARSVVMKTALEETRVFLLLYHHSGSLPIRKDLDQTEDFISKNHVYSF